MYGFFDRVLGQLGAGLTGMEGERNLSDRFAGCLRLVKAAITELKRELRLYTFTGKAEEIIYFRDMAPKIYSQLFYYMKVYAVEKYRPYVSRERFRMMLEAEMKRIDEFYVRHREVVQRASGKESYWDDHLYTRQGYGDWWVEEEMLYIDEDFTIGSYWVAMNLANAELMQWLTIQLEEFDRPVPEPVNGPGRDGTLKWTANLSDLVELIHALWLRKCMNNGKATLKDMMEEMSAFFGVDLGGKYHIKIIENARRKIDSTKFLTSLVEALKKDQEDKN